MGRNPVIIADEFGEPHRWPGRAAGVTGPGPSVTWREGPTSSPSPGRSSPDLSSLIISRPAVRGA